MEVLLSVLDVRKLFMKAISRYGVRPCEKIRSVENGRKINVDAWDGSEGRGSDSRSLENSTV
jgi:hypothetical protein